MHYYQFNIGDYMKSTLHLNHIEDLAYRRLLDRYYDTEKPLEADVKKLCRFVRMGSYETETQQVLEEFFQLTQKGWVHKRVQKELGAYSRKAEAARANGKLGGRPKKTQSVNLANPEETGSKAKQEPITNNQEPLTSKDITSANASLVFDHWVNRMGKGKSTKLTAGRKSKIAARLKEGYSVDDIKQAIDGCASSSHHMGQNDTGTVYDDLTLICRNGEKLEWFKNNIAKVKPNEQAANQPKRTSAVDRVKQGIAERQAARSGAVDASRGFDGSSMAAPIVDVRPQVLESVRGDAGRHMDSMPDGNQQITDAEWFALMPGESS